MKKNILIHAVGATTGGGLRHTNSLIMALAKLDDKRIYDVLIRENLPIESPSENIRLIRVPNKYSEKWLARIIFDLFYIPFLTRKQRYACVISLMNFGPIYLNVPHIFYQCNVLYFSPIGLSTASLKEKLGILLRRLLAFASMRNASITITPSHSTKSEIQSLYPSLRNRQFFILPHGAESQEPSQELTTNIKMKLDQGKGYKLFYPAHLYQHKAFDILISISSLLKEKIDFSLFLTIQRSENSARYDSLIKKISNLNLESNIINLGNIPQPQMGWVYKACDLMIFPSLLESFGLPLIEAMTYGCPIVASDTAINRETCGDAALFYQPLDTVDAALKIETALRKDTRKWLLKASEKHLNSRDWSWAENARQLIGLLDSVNS